MALSKGWEHVYCGTVYVSRVPPPECEYCRHLRPKVTKGKGSGWRRVSVENRKAVRPKGARQPPPSSRDRVFERDGYTCVCCGFESRNRKLLTIDHKVPRSRGGKNDEGNLQTMCKPCNVAKGDMMPAEFERARAEIAAASRKKRLGLSA